MRETYPYAEPDMPCHQTDAPLAPMRMLCGHRGQPVRNGHGRRHIHAGIAGNRRTSEARRTGDMGGMTEGDGSETSGHISRFGNRHMAEGGRTADMHALRANAMNEPVWHNANTGTDGRWRGCSAMMGDIAGRGSRHAANLRRPNAGRERARRGFHECASRTQHTRRRTPRNVPWHICGSERQHMHASRLTGFAEAMTGPRIAPPIRCQSFGVRHCRTVHAFHVRIGMDGIL